MCVCVVLWACGNISFSSQMSMSVPLMAPHYAILNRLVVNVITLLAATSVSAGKAMNSMSKTSSAKVKRLRTHTLLYSLIGSNIIKI